MARKITYSNKQTLYTDSEIGDEYKVTSGDMNEIKQVVNENSDITASKLEMSLNADGMLTVELKNTDMEILDTKQVKVVTEQRLKEYVDSLNAEEINY